MKEETKIERDNKKWKIRRYMAIISFISLVVSLLVAHFFEIGAANIPMITNLHFLFFGIIAGYFTGNSVEEIAKIKQTNKQVK